MWSNRSTILNQTISSLGNSLRRDTLFKLNCFALSQPLFFISPIKKCFRLPMTKTYTFPYINQCVPTSVSTNPSANKLFRKRNGNKFTSSTYVCQVAVLSCICHMGKSDFFYCRLEYIFKSLLMHILDVIFLFYFLFRENFDNCCNCFNSKNV